MTDRLELHPLSNFTSKHEGEAMLRRRPTDLVQSLAHGLQVMEAVGQSPDGLTAQEIAIHCGLGRPSTNRLLRTLCYEGYVRREAGRYVLGLEVAHRYRDLVSSLPRPPRLHEVLRQVAETTGHSAYFGQLVHGRVVIADVFEGPRSPHLEDLVTGFDEAAHATALGKALLSTLPAGDRRQYLREQGLRRYTRKTIADVDQLEGELRAGARTRLFTQQGQYRDGVACGAVLLDGEVQGSIAVSASMERWLRFGPSLLHQLRLRAADLSSPRRHAS